MQTMKLTIPESLRTRVPTKGDVRAVLDKAANTAVVRPVRYILRRLGYRDDAVTRVRRMAIEESAKYIDEKMMPCAIFDDRYGLFDMAVRSAPAEGLFLEFGVFNGKSINYVARRVDRPVFGFDSFEGLAEDWVGTGLLKGAFGVGGKLPKVEPNVTLIKGWFNETVPGFLESHPESIAFAHLDGDTYEATRDVLALLRPRLAVGTILQFDEYLGYPGWRVGEFKAWQEFCAQHGITYRYLGVGWMSVSTVITGLGQN